MSVGIFTAENGTKQFGMAFWYNNQRSGLQLNFWKWEIQLMRQSVIKRRLKVAGQLWKAGEKKDVLPYLRNPKKVLAYWEEELLLSPRRK